MFCFLKYIENQRNEIRIILLCCSFLFGLSMIAPKRAEAQVVDPVISFSIGPCSLDVALEKLFAEYDINVAFSKEDLSNVKVPAYSCSYKPVEDVLRDLLRDSGFVFKKIGRQYVVKKRPEVVPVLIGNADDPAVPSVVENHKVDTVLNRNADTLRIFDTLFVTRILLKRDTVVKTHTVIEHDTTFVRKRNPVEFNWPSFKNNGWFVGLSYAQGFGTLVPNLNAQGSAELYELYKQSVDFSSVRSNEVALAGGYKKNYLSFGMDISYHSVNYRFSSNRTLFEGDYYVNDTLDTYYVINQFSGDTTYLYVLDSVYVPLTSHDFSRRELNQLDYVTVGVNCAFDIYAAEYFRMFAKVGVSFDLLLSATGTAYQKVAPYYYQDLRLCSAKVGFNYSIGLGAALKVGERMELSPEVVFRQRVSSLFDNDYPVGLQMRQVGAKLGMVYYF